MSKIIIVAAVLTALSLVTGAIAAEGDVVPKRKPGAWEIITVAPVSGMTKATICVGEDNDTDGQDEFGSADRRHPAYGREARREISRPVLPRAG